MSNKEIVERLVALWEAGDLDSGEKHFDPEIQWEQPPDTVGRAGVCGVDAVRESLADWTGQFDSLRIETNDLREEGDRVFLGMTQYATAGGSSVEIVGQLYMVWWFRDGRAARMEMYNGREQAEAAFIRQAS